TLSGSFGPCVLRRRADGRFIGQGFNLTVDLPDGPYAAAASAEPDAASWAARLEQSFRKEHERKFGRTPANVPVALVNLRVTGLSAPRRQFELARRDVAGAAAPIAARPVYFKEAGGFVQTPVYRRETLPIGFGAQGPLLVEEASTTLVVGPLGHATVAPSGSLVVSIEDLQS